jgi:small conductance mechanosensitive channel
MLPILSQLSHSPIPGSSHPVHASGDAARDGRALLTSRTLAGGRLAGSPLQARRGGALRSPDMMSSIVVPLLTARFADDPSPSPSEVIEPLELEGDATQAIWWEQLLTGPVLRTGLILVAAFVVRFILNKIVDGFVKGIATVTESDLPGTGSSSVAREVVGPDHLRAQRRISRAETMGRLFKNVGFVIILTIAILMILGEWGFNVAPLLAGAGILGVALGFGAQSLVSDFLSGVFMLLEDQYGVGDIVEINGTAGTVEDVHLRVTRLRSIDGVVWWVRNGEVTKVGNMSQHWSTALLDISVSYDSDIPTVRRLMAEEAHGMVDDEVWGPLLLEEPEVWGVQEFGADGIMIRMIMRTRPGEQWGVAREYRERIKARFDAEGVVIPFPQREVWLRHEDTSAPEGLVPHIQPARTGGAHDTRTKPTPAAEE